MLNQPKAKHKVVVKCINLTGTSGTEGGNHYWHLITSGKDSSQESQCASSQCVVASLLGKRYQ